MYRHPLMKLQRAVSVHTFCSDDAQLTSASLTSCCGTYNCACLHIMCECGEAPRWEAATEQKSKLYVCRIESALQGKCSFECEDQLQHVLSIHLRTRYLAAELSQDEIARNEPDYEGSPDHKPAVFLHHKIERMWQKYSSLRPDRSWFDVQAVATADSQY